MRQVHRRMRFGVERRLLDAADYADDGALFFFKSDAEAFSDRILTRPETRGENVVDDDHQRRVSTVLRGELPALQEWDLESREIVWRNDRVISYRTLRILHRLLAFEKQFSALGRAGEWQRKNRAGALDTGHRLKPVHQLLKERRLLLIFFVPRRRKVRELNVKR